MKYIKFTKTNIISTLYTINDPEIPINIVDLGIIYTIQIRRKTIKKLLIKIYITLTSHGCNMWERIAQDVKNSINKLDYTYKSEVVIIYFPTWTPDLITESGKMALIF